MTFFCLCWKLKPWPEEQIPRHSWFSNGIIYGPHRGSFEVHIGDDLPRCTALMEAHFPFGYFCWTFWIISQAVLFILEISQLFEAKLTYHLHSARNFRNFWVNLFPWLSGRDNLNGKFSESSCGFLRNWLHNKITTKEGLSPHMSTGITQQ